MIDAKECGRRIKEARQKTGFTQQEAADKLGMTCGAYSQYEQGRYAPSFPKILWLIDKLDLDLSIVMPELVPPGIHFKPDRRSTT